MALKLPRVDADSLRELVRDVDLSRLAELRDDLARDARDLDLTRLRDDLSRVDLAGELRRRDIELPRVELPSVDRLLGRDAARTGIALPAARPAILAALGIILAGALLGGLAAYFLQPGAGERRRAAVRKQVRRVLRKVKRTIQGR
ncbi:MAG: hypothetical protein KF809_14730 [Chloroflexi bacterium]|nr:hypothetical protein [Chloroflexota bacterium]